MNEGLLATIAYSDIFEYPLTLSEIHRYFQADRPVESGEIRKALLDAKEIDSHGDYFFLKGRKKIVSKRKLYEQESKKKIEIAKKIARILSYIPTIYYIAISGSLAQENAGPEDDIDLFFVTRSNTVWLSRACINSILISLRQKRKKHVRMAPDKICPNMILSECTLTVPPASRNLYIAREIAHLLPLVDKKNVHGTLLAENEWIRQFLPNTYIPQAICENSKSSKILSYIDDAAMTAQKKYMNITNETISKNVAKFHPRDTSQIVMSLYLKRLIAVLGSERANQVFHAHNEFNFSRK